MYFTPAVAVVKVVIRSFVYLLAPVGRTVAAPFHMAILPGREVRMLSRHQTEIGNFTLAKHTRCSAFRGGRTKIYIYFVEFISYF